MGRRWRGRRYVKKVVKEVVKEVVITPEKAAHLNACRRADVIQRRVKAAQFNVELANVQLPRIRADLARYRAIVEKFVDSRGVAINEAHLLKEKLEGLKQSIEQAEARRGLAQYRIGEATKAIANFTESDKQSQGIFRSILFGYTPSPDVVSKISQLRQIIQTESAFLIENDTTQQLSEGEQAFIAAFGMVGLLEHSIQHHEGADLRLAKLKEEEERASQAIYRTKKKLGLNEAIVAAFLDKTRDLADDIKKQLVHQILQSPQCPYCGGNYGDEPHADHIYPVSKGGLSVLANMVLVCCRCNLKKSDMTLREFILQSQLDRSFIEMNLDRLGKEF